MHPFHPDTWLALHQARHRALEAIADQHRLTPRSVAQPDPGRTVGRVRRRIARALRSTADLLEPAHPITQADAIPTL